MGDLIEAGLLEPNQDLWFTQRIGQQPHSATVTGRGHIRLYDGQEFNTPSGAATVAAGRGADGWVSWRVGSPDGPFLHHLRQRLLEMVAGEVESAADNSSAEADAVKRRFAELNEARASAESGHPRAMTVRELLRLWGVDDRDRLATGQIDADLANHGLVTEPDYRAVNIDRTIRLTTVASQIMTSADESFTSTTAVGVVSDEEIADFGLTLGNLLNENLPLVSVGPTATFMEAITLMQLNDFSQLAVLADGSSLYGAVSWKSIAEARHRNSSADFDDAIDRSAQSRVFDYKVRVLDVLSVLQAEDYVFVRDFDGVISGIITAADVVGTYDETATPFFLIGEIDQELRQLIQSTFDETTVRGACRAGGSPFREFETMTIGQYQAVLNSPVCWTQLGWPLDRAVFIERLDEIRKIRNTVMHFNPDPLGVGDVGKLRNFVRLIRDYRRL